MNRVVPKTPAQRAPQLADSAEEQAQRNVVQKTGDFRGLKITGDAHALLTVEEVAELLKVPVSWVYERTRLRSANRIPGFRLGKYWRFRELDVQAWLERQRDRTRPNA